MPIEVQCAGCQKRLRVGDEHAGRQAKCPQCQMIFTVPRPAVSQPVAPQPAAQPVAPEGQAAAASPSDRWYLQTEHGQQYGPITRAELNRWVAEGRVSGAAQVFAEGDTAWRRADEHFPVLRAVASAPAAPQWVGAPAPTTLHSAASTNPFGDNYATSPYAAPQVNAYATSSLTQYGSRRYLKPHRGGVVLALAIVGWTLCWICGVAAWIMGAYDLEDMRRGRMDRDGEGLTRVGMILGMVQTILMGLTVVLIVLFAAAAGVK